MSLRDIEINIDFSGVVSEVLEKVLKEKVSTISELSGEYQALQQVKQKAQTRIDLCSERIESELKIVKAIRKAIDIENGLEYGISLFSDVVETLDELENIVDETLTSK